MRNYIIKEKTRHSNEKSALIKCIIVTGNYSTMRSSVCVLLLFAAKVYAGKEIQDPAVAWQMFNTFYCTAYSIRAQLDFGVKFSDAISIPLDQRWQQFEKFDQLWQDFESCKKYLKRTITNPHQRACICLFEVVMKGDKCRYDTERKTLQEHYQNVRVLRR